MDETLFARGQEAERYVDGMRNYRSLVRKLFAAASSFPVPLEFPRKEEVSRATVCTEDWCGDSACVTPILARFFAVHGIPFRVFRGSEHRDVHRFYEESGTDHIPVLSLWDSSGGELVRWVEAPKAAQEKKASWKEAHPEFMELYGKRADGDRDAARAFGVMYRDFLEEMAGWYQQDLWAITLEEVSRLLSPGQ